MIAIVAMKYIFGVEEKNLHLRETGCFVCWLKAFWNRDVFKISSRALEEALFSN